MKHVEQIFVIVVIASVAWFIHARPKTVQAVNTVSDNVPWYMTYNVPSGFTGGSAPLPNVASAQDGVATNTCTLCNILTPAATGASQY